MNRKLFFRRAAALFVLCALLSGSAFASSIEVTPKKPYALTAEVFSSEPFDGIYISSLPSEDVCSVKLGGRTLREGDVLDAGALSELKLCSSGLVQMDAEIGYRTVSGDTLSDERVLSFRLKKSQDTIPVANDSCFETYKNVSYTGKLDASDLDGDVLRYAVQKQPKRGSVELSEDGTFVYTPSNNKVGADRFTFNVTDPDGHVSEAATVEIKIKKPLDDAAYTDLRGTTDEYYAVWLREKGAFSGKTLGGNYVFEPSAPVTRGEFLVMAMNVFGQKPDAAIRRTGFSDELSAPVFVRPYMAQALRCGYISGSVADNALVFRPDEPISFSEAAVITQNIAKLPKAAAKPVSAFSSDAVPTWAAEAVSSLSDAGVSLAIPEDGSITRLACAKLLYEAVNAKQ